MGSLVYKAFLVVVVGETQEPVWLRLVLPPHREKGKDQGRQSGTRKRFVFPFHVCAQYVCVYTCFCMCGCTHVCEHAYGHLRLMLGIIFNCSSISFTEEVLSVEPSAPWYG